MSVRYLLLAAALLAVLAVAGCGASSDSSTTALLAPVKYAHKTDRICGDASIEQGDLARAYLEKHPNAKEVDLVIPAAVPPIEKWIAELHDLGMPRGHEEEAKAFLEEAEAALENLKNEPKGALSQKGNPFKKANKLAANLELGDCSQNP